MDLKMIRQIAGDGYVGAYEDIVESIATSSNTIYLYGNAAFGREVTIKCNNSSGNTTVAVEDSSLIDGQSSFVLSQYDALKVVFNGTNWMIA